MSTPKEQNDTLLDAPSSASVIEEEDTIVVNEKRCIIKDSDIKAKVVASKQGKIQTQSWNEMLVEP